MRVDCVKIDYVVDNFGVRIEYYVVSKASPFGPGISNLLEEHFEMR